MLFKARVLISGRVQGVFYRDWTVKKAKKLGVSGWVRNRLDGKVEAVVIGSEEKVKQMLDWFWQGSPLSRVDEVKVISFEKIKQDPLGGKFEKRPTA